MTRKEKRSAYADSRRNLRKLEEEQLQKMLSDPNRAEKERRKDHVDHESGQQPDAFHTFGGQHLRETLEQDQSGQAADDGAGEIAFLEQGHGDSHGLAGHHEHREKTEYDYRRHKSPCCWGETVRIGI